MSRDISESEDTKTVQTEVPTQLYERFTTASQDRGMTIKDATAEAIREFADRYLPVDPDDPLFAPLAWDETGGDRDDDAAATVDDIVYGADH